MFRRLGSPRADVLTVMIRVFEGGEGVVSGGRSERSSESGDLVRDDVRECCGEGRSVAMAVVMFSRVCGSSVVCEGVERCGERPGGRNATLCTRFAHWVPHASAVTDAPPRARQARVALPNPRLRQLFPHLLATSAPLLRPRLECSTNIMDPFRRTAERAASWNYCPT